MCHVHHSADQKMDRLGRRLNGIPVTGTWQMPTICGMWLSIKKSTSGTHVRIQGKRRQLMNSEKVINAVPCFRTQAPFMVSKNLVLDRVLSTWSEGFTLPRPWLASELCPENLLLYTQCGIVHPLLMNIIPEVVDGPNLTRLHSSSGQIQEDTSRFQTCPWTF